MKLRLQSFDTLSDEKLKSALYKVWDEIPPKPSISWLTPSSNAASSCGRGKGGISITKLITWEGGMVIRKGMKRKKSVSVSVQSLFVCLFFSY